MEFKENTIIETSELWYDMFEEYVKPEEVLQDEKDIQEVKAALKTLRNFEKSAEDQGVLIYF